MTSRSGLSALWESGGETWLDRAACKGLDSGIFEPADMDTHPGTSPTELSAITSARYAYAKKICISCPVRLECEEDASTPDGLHTVRGGLSPADRGYKKVPGTNSPVKSGRVPGRPKGTFRVASEELLRDFERAFREGHSTDELKALLGLGADRVHRMRRDFLRAFCTGEPDAMIRSWIKSERTGKYYSTKIGGPAWTLGRSTCGTLVHVALRREGKVQSFILRSKKIEFARSDVPILKGSRQPPRRGVDGDRT